MCRYCCREAGSRLAAAIAAGKAPLSVLLLPLGLQRLCFLEAPLLRHGQPGFLSGSDAAAVGDAATLQPTHSQPQCCPCRTTASRAAAQGRPHKQP